MQIQTRDGWNSSVLVFQSSSIPNSCSLNLLFLPTSGPKCLNHLKSTPCIPISFALWNPEVFWNHFKFLLKSLSFHQFSCWNPSQPFRGHIVGLLEELRVSLASRRRSSRPSGRFSGISELADVADAAPRASHRSSMDSVQMAWKAMAIHGDSWRKKGWNGLEMVGDGWGPTFWSEEMRTWFKYKMDIIPQLKVESWNPSMGAKWYFWKAWDVETCFQSLVWKVRRLRAQQSWPPCIGVENYWCRDMQSTWPPKIRLEGTCSFFGSMRQQAHRKQWDGLVLPDWCGKRDRWRAGAMHSSKVMLERM